MMRRDRHLLFGLAALTLAIALLVGGHSDVLLAVPVLVFALPLMAGRYFGEERLARIAAAFVSARERAAPSLAMTARRAAHPLPRGGHLIASSLAVRPPPGRSLQVNA
ncbi:MAG: hypothetical protein QOE11_2044 [Solirubrobacteraceae bacterium]|nr:hypothetical protein [Solirubrobacteraceae bacterium]